jgi:flagellin
MALTVNTNRASVVAQRNLARSATALERNIERLSSGYRINSARDDSAGLSIATRLDTRIRGLGQAVRNTNDGISFAQTAEAALNDVSTGLVRIRELAIQAANDTNDEDDRAALQEEVVSIIAEIGRIAEETTFNGVRPLADNGRRTYIHLGAGSRESVGLASVDARKTQLGRYVRVEGNAVLSTGALAGGALQVNGTSIRGTVAADDTASYAENAGSAIAVARALNASEPFTQVSAYATATQFTGANVVTGGTLNDTDYLSVNGSQITGFVVQGNDADGALQAAINAVADDTGVLASLSETFELVLTADDGRNIAVELSTDDAATFTGLRAASGTSNAGGRVVLESDRAIRLVFADADTANRLGLNNGAPGTLTLGIDGDNALSTIDVSTRAGAERAIDLSDSALRQVSRFRSTFGAVTNRLESTVENLSSQGEFLSAARSRIVDADFAAETAALARNSFLKDAGLAVLAQANVSTSAALSLLS